MYVYGVKDKSGAFYHVGQTSMRVNVRMNWHWWKSRQKDLKGFPFNAWLATKTRDDVEVVILAETDDPFRLTMLECEFAQKLIQEGHPLFVNSNKGKTTPRRGHTLSPEHVAALARGRKNSQFFGSDRPISKSAQLKKLDAKISALQRQLQSLMALRQQVSVNTD